MTTEHIVDRPQKRQTRDRESILESLEREGIEFLRLTFTDIVGHNKNVEVLLGAVKSKFPNHATIPGRCDERIQYPHTTANRNTSWARILLAFELANDMANAGQVDMELDHPEATTN